MGRVLAQLGAERAFVVHGLDGMDEITLCAPTQITEVDDGTVRTSTIAPEQFGLKRAALDDLRGGTPQENAAMAVAILNGEDRGPRRDIVVLNAGVALVAAGIATSVEDGLARAAESIESGRAYERLEALRLRTKFA
jgi:anthranilate phosphoribosyltransferase